MFRQLFIITFILLFSISYNILPARKLLITVPFILSDFSEQKADSDDKLLDDVTVEQIINAPAMYQDRLLAVKGRYLAWHGNITSSPPVTRSDWILADVKTRRCIYVSGKRPYGVKIGDIIIVISILRHNKRGYYLKSVKIIGEEIKK
jgi:hypothetical protein